MKMAINVFGNKIQDYGGQAIVMTLGKIRVFPYMVIVIVLGQEYGSQENDNLSFIVSFQFIVYRR